MRADAGVPGSRGRWRVADAAGSHGEDDPKMAILGISRHCWAGVQGDNVDRNEKAMRTEVKLLAER